MPVCAARQPAGTWVRHHSRTVARKSSCSTFSPLISIEGMVLQRSPDGPGLPQVGHLVGGEAPIDEGAGGVVASSRGWRRNLGNGTAEARRGRRLHDALDLDERPPLPVVGVV